MKILVIDDNSLLARSLGRMLKHDTVEIELDGRRGRARVVRAAFAGEPFALVLCDLSMPTMNGLDVLAELRALDDPPILVLMTGYDHVIEARGDADGILAKPFKCEDVYDLVADITARRARAAIHVSACGLDR